MKTLKICKPAAIAAIIGIVIGITACGGGGEPPPPKPQAKAQTGTIEVQLDVKRNVTVKGDSFTDAEWNTIKNQLVTAIQDGFTTGDKSFFLDVLAGRPEFIINVDKTPSGYTNWKTIDSKTLYIANGKITAKNIQDGINSVFTGVPETGQVIQPHDLFVRRAAA